MKSAKLCFAVGAVALSILLWTAAADAQVSVVNASSNAQPPRIRVLDSTPAVLQLTVETPQLGVEAVKTASGEFFELGWSDAGFVGQIGTPKLPVVRRLFIAPLGATVQCTAQPGSVTEITTASLDNNIPLRPMPVQPPIEKLPGAAENAPFVFDAAAYAVDETYPAERATVEELGLVRGQRVFLLTVYPVACNPGQQTLTVCNNISVSIAFSNASGESYDISPMPGLRRLVLNPEMMPATPRDRGSGNYLIVVTSGLQSDIASFAAAKTAQGFTVSTYVPPSASNTVIRDYILSQYNNPPTAPDYVLLVGDTDTIPHWVGGGEGTPSTDLNYVCMDGDANTAWRTPDIAIGRFPARTADQLSAMVNKTLYWENGPLADPNYVKRAVFMASEDNYTVSEGTHNWVIANYMIPNEIAYDRLYCHTYSATTQQVRNAFNNGRYYGIYSGHGANTYWADGPVFYQSDVQALTNLNMYSVVYSFSCVTGTYTDNECFMETWVRVPSKGAAVAIGSSVNSYWTEDDMLEKRLFDSIYDENDGVVAEVGPVWNDTRARYIAQMGTGQTTRRYFEMYNIMGDPALGYPGSCSDAGVIQIDSTKYACADSISLTVSDCGLNTNPNAVDTVTVTVTSTSEPAGESVILSETNPNSARFEGLLNLSTTNAPGVLLVAAGDVVTATYNDADTGGGQPAVVTATAVVDCTPPVIGNIQAINIEPRSATVSFTANEPVRGTVRYGTSCGNLAGTASGSGFSTTPTVALTGLQDSTTYFFVVDAVDEAGNLVTDTNYGSCYSFSTPEVPDFYTELFDANDNDLDYLSLTFTPNGTVDYYAACAEPITALPVDPTGGTTVTLSDDSFAQVTLSGGATVNLYGTSYNSFYIGSNGYITFGSSDTGYTESFANHFSKPRIAGAYDDLNPSSGGTVSWRQLADKAVVTYLNVREYSSTNTVTFQIEMHFNGTIVLSFLDVQITDGLAGLSRGTGVDPDFLESDLSGLGNCGPQPPTASNVSRSTAVSVPVLVTLTATDDGLPNPPGALVYVITSLPGHGSLSDPNGGAIGSVPYTLANGGNQVLYTPVPNYRPSDSFQYQANDGGTPPEGGASNTALVSLTIGGSAWDPVAHSQSLSTGNTAPTTITLTGTDPNGDPLTYVLESLPAAGTGLLVDPASNQVIGAVPYTLSGSTVKYLPPFGATLNTSFTFTVRDATATSNVATVSVTLGAGVPQVVYSFPLDSNPGWSTEASWAYGTPTGGGTHNRDPNSGYTGSSVYGYNLNGDYPNNMTVTRYLTTTAMDCRYLNQTTLRFRRWLGVEGSAHDLATIEVSNNGSTWSQVWLNPSASAISESAWSLQTYNIASLADGQATVYVRWGMGPTDVSVSYPGWNLDDVEIVGVVNYTCASAVAGDVNNDGLVNGLDIQGFTTVALDPYGPGVTFVEFCGADVNQDGFVTLDDVPLFVNALLGL